ATAARDPASRLAIAAAIGAVGSTLGNAGQLAEGAAELKRALAMEELILGADHPEVARTVHDLAAIQRDLGELAESERGLLRVRTIFAAAFGEGSLEVAATDAALAYLAIIAGQLERAHELAVRARAGFVRTNAGPALLSSIDTALGNIEQNRERCAAAIPHYERALASSREAGETGGLLAVAYVNLAACLADVGRDPEARNALEAGLSAWEAAGDAGPERAQALAILADLEARAGRRGRAIELAKQVLAAIDGLEGEPFEAIREHVRDQLAIWRR
ncbi:MAG: tetratricopeptide repeat protein, partial [Myxococcota bacterium]|nr:tetratricopeptide repeat protein [Myxococcota bacterium]